MNNKGLKSARNVGVTRIKKNNRKKPTKKLNIDDVNKIENLLKCLDDGNITPVRNYLKSKLPRKKSNKTKESEIIAKEFKSELIKNATKSEKQVKKLLKELKITFIFQREFFYKKGKFYILDFYLPLNRIAIEIDGEYHDSDEQIKKDNIRQKHIEDKNIKVIRFKNEEVFELNFKDILANKIIEYTFL